MHKKKKGVTACAYPRTMFSSFSIWTIANFYVQYLVLCAELPKALRTVEGDSSYKTLKQSQMLKRSSLPHKLQ